jgi:hypothetical protein
MRRKQNFQPIAWFWDLYQRDRLKLDPPYQRRSVWNQNYRDYFIDTLLLQYPAPAIFLYELIKPDGVTVYNVVDGKQRLLAIFDFVTNRFPVSLKAERSEFRDRYFRDLPDNPEKLDFWGYQFSVEYIPTEDESVINNIFDRINRNTAKLSPQELRKARFDGEFITAVQQMSERLFHELPEGFPNIALQSRRQMKDDEVVAHLLLLLEVGPKGYSSAELDEAFSSRDEEWAEKPHVMARFDRVLDVLRELTRSPYGPQLVRSRLRNQADFYSLYGAMDLVLLGDRLPSLQEIAERLLDFADRVDLSDSRITEDGLRRYYDAARSASNDAGPRGTRIKVVQNAILGLPLTSE